MKTILLGVGEHAASSTPGDVLKVLGLGSCVALVFLDPRARTVGMAHVALPDSRAGADLAATEPGRFADTAVPALLEAMVGLGTPVGGRRCVVKLVGGAEIMPNNSFNIGKRNALAIKKALWRHGMGAIVEDLGGDFSRSVAAFVDTGQVVVTATGLGCWEI